MKILFIIQIELMDAPASCLAAELEELLKVILSIKTHHRAEGLSFGAVSPPAGQSGL
jgi:hypothetical protein